VLFEAKSGWVSHPRVAPDGQTVAFVHHPDAGDSRGELMVMRPRTPPERWSEVFEGLGPMVWDGDGESLLITASMHGEPVAVWRARRGRPPSVIYRETSDLFIGDRTRDGRLLVIAVDWRQSSRFSTQELRATALGEANLWENVAGLSRSGAVLYVNAAAEGQQISLQAPEATAPVGLGSGVPLDLSLDGHWALATTSAPSGELLILPTGPGPRKTVTVPGLMQIESAVFFPDGQRAAVIGPDARTGDRRVQVLDLEKEVARSISPVLPRQTHIAVSPDHRWVAAVPADGVVTAFAVDAGAPLRATELGQDMLVAGWTEAGELVAFERRALPSRVLRFDVATGRGGRDPQGPDDPRRENLRLPLQAGKCAALLPRLARPSALRASPAPDESRTLTHPARETP
jgi:hypothetical protein